MEEFEVTERRVVQRRRRTPPLPKGTEIPEKMTAPQVAELCGVTRQTVVHWERNGLIQPVETYPCNNRTVKIYLGSDVERLLSPGRRPGRLTRANDAA